MVAKQHQSEVCDLLIVGGGAAGLTAAVTARINGLDVLLAEKMPQLGGTSAISGGQLWIPGNPHARVAGIEDKIANARKYIQKLAGSNFNARNVDAFLGSGPEMIEFFESRTAVRFTDEGNGFADYSPAMPGAATGGRTIVPRAYHAGPIRRDIRLLASRRYWALLMGMQIGALDRRQFVNAFKAPSSALYVLNRLVGYAGEWLTHRRAMTLMDGNSLVAQLLETALDSGVRIWTDAPVSSLKQGDTGISGAVVEYHGTQFSVMARHGVVLASGGFSHDANRAKSTFRHVAFGSSHFAISAPGNTGDGSRMAEAVGGRFEKLAGGNNAAWAPAVVDPRHDAPDSIAPVFSRGSPGIIAVMRDGLRFGNEADSYHDFVQYMIRAAKALGMADVSCHLICDHRTIRRYGLADGVVRPFPYPVAPHLRSGLLVKAGSIAELGALTGIDQTNLQATVTRINDYARTGVDPEFARGESAYNKMIGDPDVRPNSCLGTIERAPFYAMKIHAGHIATFAGLKTDQHARVLDKNNLPIVGLYAAGNDMLSVFGGSYPGRGGTLGPGMTFAYIAAKHAVAMSQ